MGQWEKKIQTKESSRSRSGNPIWRLIIVLSFSSSEPEVELQTVTVKLSIVRLTKLSSDFVITRFKMRLFLGDFQWRRLKIKWIDATFPISIRLTVQPPKMEIVHFLQTSLFCANKALLTSHFTRCTTFHCFASFCTAHANPHEHNQNHWSHF